MMAGVGFTVIEKASPATNLFCKLNVRQNVTVASIPMNANNVDNRLALTKDEVVAIHGTYDSKYYGSYYYVRTFADKNGTIEREASDPKRWMFIEKSNTTVPLTVNGWLTMYAGPTVAGDPTHSIDLEIKEYDQDGNPVYYPKPIYWAAFGDRDISKAYGDDSVYEQIRKLHPVVENKIRGARINENGRYWIWVGPSVLKPNFDPNKMPLAPELNWNVKIDVIVRDKVTGLVYYVPCVPGGTKGHTWPGGIFQTGYAFPGGVDYQKDHRDPSAVEFMAPSSLLDEACFRHGYEAIGLNIHNN